MGSTYDKEKEMKKALHKLPLFEKRLAELKGTKKDQPYAKELGISRQTLRAWLDGYKVPDLPLLMKIAERTGKPIDWLLGLVPYETQDVDTRAIIKETGLSESAVSTLLEIECYGKSKQLLNTLLEHHSFLEDIAEAFSRATEIHERMTKCDDAECFNDDLLARDLNRRLDGEYNNRFSIRTNKQAFNDYAQDIASLIKELIDFAEQEDK